MKNLMNIKKVAVILLVCSAQLYSMNDNALLGLCAKNYALGSPEYRWRQDQLNNQNSWGNTILSRALICNDYTHEQRQERRNMVKALLYAGAVPSKEDERLFEEDPLLQKELDGYKVYHKQRYEQLCKEHAQRQELARQQSLADCFESTITRQMDHLALQNDSDIIIQPAPTSRFAVTDFTLNHDQRWLVPASGIVAPKPVRITLLPTLRSERKIESQRAPYAQRPMLELVPECKEEVECRLK